MVSSALNEEYIYLHIPEHYNFLPSSCGCLFVFLLLPNLILFPICLCTCSVLTYCTCTSLPPPLLVSLPASVFCSVSQRLSSLPAVIPVQPVFFLKWLRVHMWVILTGIIPNFLFWHFETFHSLMNCIKIYLFLLRKLNTNMASPQDNKTTTFTHESRIKYKHI